MNTVWVLIALAFNGHITNAVIPTLEFSSWEKCEAAIQAFRNESAGKAGTAHMRCVKIEK